ncbi:MAG: DUF3850 domain-containing protein [Thermodesulfobacteriota bacterium]|jgi:co-chaperonin GroES (HSP10)
MTVNQKVEKEIFAQIAAGKRRAELQLANFAVREGDTLVLEEWDQEAQEYTGRKVETVVTAVVKTKEILHRSPEEVEKHGLQLIHFEPKESKYTPPSGTDA